MDDIFDLDHLWKRGAEELVYHYTAWETARDHVLGGLCQLKINPIDRMEDPLEFEAVKPNLSGDFKAHDGSPLRVWAAIEKTTRSEIKLFCVSQDQSAITSPVIGRKSSEKPMLQIHQTAIRGFAHPSMWHHYGDKHEGVCLIFSKSRLDKVIRNIAGLDGYVLCGDIVYKRDLEMYKAGLSFSSGELPVKTDDVENLVRQRMLSLHGKRLFFSKHTDWAPEMEYRWVVSTSTVDPLFVPISNALVAVVVGSDFDSQNNQEIEELTKALKVPIRRIWWKDGSASPPWDLECFEPGKTLESWEARAKIRRNRRRGIV